MINYTLKLKKPFLKDTEGKEIRKDIIVGRINVPNLPMPRHPVLRFPLTAVICAFKYDRGWGFVTLTGEQKEEIGDALMVVGVPVGEWSDVMFLDEPSVD